MPIGRRGPIGVRRRGPGLVGTMARTAVIAGTANATVNAMNRGAANRQQAQAADQTAYQNQAELEQMRAEMEAMQSAQVQAAAAPAAAPAPAAAGLTEQLQQLAQLKQSGILSDAEFEAAKAKLLAG